MFLDKKSKKPELEPGTSRTQSKCVTSAPPSQLRVTIVVKLFNCFDAMGWFVNKQTHFQQSHFSEIFLPAWITSVGSFSYLRDYVSLLKYG